MPLTPEDVRNKQFTTVRLREGYDEDEVDHFLDEVEGELTRLLRENDDLRAKLAAATRSAAAAPPTAPQPAVREVVREEPKKPTPAPAQAPAPVPAQAVSEATVTDGAARVLALAQQTADQAIGEARNEANKVVGDARSKAEAIERDARAKAEALERDAADKHRTVIGQLDQQRIQLERKVEELRSFEREYRSRLKSYLEGQLRQLESQGDTDMAGPRGGKAPAPAGAAAARGAAAVQPRQPMRGFLVEEDES